MTEEQWLAKNAFIKEAMQATHEKRKSQVCRAYKHKKVTFKLLGKTMKNKETIQASLPTYDDLSKLDVTSLLKYRRTLLDNIDSINGILSEDRGLIENQFKVIDNLRKKMIEELSTNIKNRFMCIRIPLVDGCVEEYYTCNIPFSVGWYENENTQDKIHFKDALFEVFHFKTKYYGASEPGTTVFIKDFYLNYRDINRALLCEGGFSIAFLTDEEVAKVIEEHSLKHLTLLINEYKWNLYNRGITLKPLSITFDVLDEKTKVEFPTRDKILAREHKNEW